MLLVGIGCSVMGYGVLDWTEGSQSYWDSGFIVCIAYSNEKSFMEFPFVGRFT